jgi:hypothetical protein
MVWLGLVAIGGLVLCALWAFGDHVRSRMIRDPSPDPMRLDQPRSIVALKLLLGVIVVIGLAVLGLTAFLVVVELRG